MMRHRATEARVREGGQATQLIAARSFGDRQILLRTIVASRCPRGRCDNRILAIARKVVGGE
jgi:hypothetical protein